MGWVIAGLVGAAVLLLADRMVRVLGRWGDRTVARHVERALGPDAPRLPHRWEEQP